MIDGKIDEEGRALIQIKLSLPGTKIDHVIEAWIDTAFTGELVLPRELISRFQFPQSSGIRALLADGSEAILEAFTASLDWFGDERIVEVIANEGQIPLLGIALLRKRRLALNFRTNVLGMD